MTEKAMTWDDWNYECWRTCDQVDGECKKCPIEQKCKDLTRIIDPSRMVN